VIAVTTQVHSGNGKRSCRHSNFELAISRLENGHQFMGSHQFYCWGIYLESVCLFFFFFFFLWMAEECVDIWNTYFKLYLIYIIGTVSYCLDLLL
jgi:hypothetical protein